MDNSKILLIDICGTLYQSNTTFDMLNLYFGRQPLYRFIKILRRSKITGFVNNMIFRLFHVDIIRKIVIRYLNGLPKEKIADMTEEFYKSFLLDRINKQSFEVIESYRKEGSGLIIVSATMDCIANCVAKHNDIHEVLSSKLHFTNEVCDGYLYDDLLGTKMRHFKELGLNKPYDIITDNYSDNDLIKEAKKAYLIQYKDKKNKWESFLTSKDLEKCKILEIG